MTFDDCSFDVLIDKGTLDAILCGAESARHATAMLTECARVMKGDGVLCIVTYGAPSSRLSYLEQTRYGWEVTYEMLGGTRYLYVCRKSATQATVNGTTTTDKEGDRGKS
jgi:ubiquinone/menaquinone biosynthesis C-methylase UbiE